MGIRCVYIPDGKRRADGQEQPRIKEGTGKILKEASKTGRPKHSTKCRTEIRSRHILRPLEKAAANRKDASTLPVQFVIRKHTETVCDTHTSSCPDRRRPAAPCGAEDLVSVAMGYGVKARTGHCQLGPGKMALHGTEE